MSPVAFALWLVLASTGSSTCAFAQATAPDKPVYISAGTIAALAARSAKAQSGKSTATLVTPLLRQGAFKAQLEYREGPSPDVHAHEAEGELFVVLQGSGTMLLGGDLVDPITRAGTRHAARVVGGRRYHLAPGDVVLLPENMPHSVINVDGRLVMMSMHLPRPGASQEDAGGANR